jgi:hypothetical protein
MRGYHSPSGYVGFIPGIGYMLFETSGAYIEVYQEMQNAGIFNISNN